MPHADPETNRRYQLEWYHKNKNRLAEQRNKNRKIRRAANHEKTIADYAKYREKYKLRRREVGRAYMRRQRLEHPEKIAAALAAVRAKRKRGVPKHPAIEDKAAIEQIYAMCRETTRLTGIPHHVDHIIPLCGKNVSGLHVSWNMQILTAEANVTKKNYLIEPRIQ